MKEDAEKKTPKKIRLNRGHHLCFNEISHGDMAISERSKHRQQKFRSEWMKNEIFKMWLMPMKSNELEAYCKFCKQKMISETGVLKNHVKVKSNISIMLSGNKKQPPISMFTTKEKCPDLQKQQLISIAEINLAAYFAEHNVPFLGADHLSDLFPDSDIAKNINVKRTKTTAIIKNVIGSSQKFKLAEKLKKQKFSLMTDESTDIGTIKTSCVVVRFYDESSETIESVFWQLHNVYDTDNPSSASAKHLFNSLISTLTDYEIPLRRLEHNIL